jgi:N-acetylmuramoyl-L-alanine amidase
MPLNKRDRLPTVLCALLFAVAGFSGATAQQSSPSPVPAPSPTATAKPAQPEFVVMIDPAHGGDDKGAVFGPRLLEKDITLAFARALRKELEQRGIPARLLRESDVSLTLQHRAELSNQQRAGVYVALHAGAPGKGVRVYSSLLASRQQAAGRFIAWDSAQTGSLDRSAALARSVARELQKNGVRVRNLAASLRPMNNLISPAIAVELAADGSDIRSIESQKLQAAVATAIASGIAQMRGHLGGHP